jgi:hypothetical protein
MCLGVAARRVSADGPELLIDGSPAGRPINVEDASAARMYAKRGGNAMRRSKT